MFATVVGDHARGRDVRDALGDQRHAWRRQRAHPLVGEDDALAADGVGRPQALAQGGVLHLALQVQAGQGHEPALRGRAGLEAAPEGLGGAGPEQAHGAVPARQREQQAVERAVAAVEAWQHPVGRALEHRHLRAAAHELGHQLRGGGAGADHAHAAAGQRQAGVPARGVQARAGKARQAVDGRPARHRERPGAADEGAGVEHAAVVELQAPAAAGLVERGARDAAAQPQVRQQALGLGQALLVGQDLGRRGEAAAPARVGREAEAVQRRRHVHRGAGVAVVPPGAAQARAAFDDDEVVAAGALERRSHGQPRHAGAEDGDVDALHGRSFGHARILGAGGHAAC